MKYLPALGLCLCLSGIAGPVGATIVADLRQDYVNGTSDGDLASFSALSGSWSYVASDTANPTLDGDGLVTLEWSVAGNNYRNPDGSGEPNATINHGLLAADEVFFHPKNSNLNPRFAVARWTSVQAGDIFIDGGIRDLDFGGGDGVTFEIYVDGVSVFNQNIFNNSASFGFSQTVGAGSFVDFVIGPNGFADFDSTALSAAISVPEPTTFALLAIAGLGAVVYRWRKRKTA